ncbi:MAG: SurA N-terminal domain-containing protein [Desulfosarcinaceae bacterium]
MWTVWFVFAVLALGACSQKPDQDDYLVRVGSQSVTVGQFKQAVEMAGEEAFAGEGEQKSGDFKDLQVRVLNQLSEELVILEKAKALGIGVSEAEIDQAVNRIKADYPDNTFEETLLENAVSFSAWRKRLASRLIIEKVIAKELVDKVTIRPEDVAGYYHAHYPEGTPEDANEEDVNRRIVKHLRQQKAEQDYKEWIEKLRKAYPVELNRKQWDRLNKEQEGKS